MVNRLFFLLFLAILNTLAAIMAGLLLDFFFHSLGLHGGHLLWWVPLKFSLAAKSAIATLSMVLASLVWGCATANCMILIRRHLIYGREPPPPLSAWEKWLNLWVIENVGVGVVVFTAPLLWQGRYPYWLTWMGLVLALAIVWEVVNYTILQFLQNRHNAKLEAGAYDRIRRRWLTPRKSNRAAR